MPSKSKAQFREMGYLYSQGKITKKQLNDFNGGIHLDALPERIGEKRGVKPKRTPR